MKLIIDIPKDVVTAIQNGEDYRYDITANVRKTWNGETMKFIENEAFDAQFRETLKKRCDCFLTVVDIHD